MNTFCLVLVLLLLVSWYLYWVAYKQLEEYKEIAHRRLGEIRQLTCKLSDLQEREHRVKQVSSQLEALFAAFKEVRDSNAR